MSVIRDFRARLAVWEINGFTVGTGLIFTVGAGLPAKQLMLNPGVREQARSYSDFLAFITRGRVYYASSWRSLH